MGGSKPSQLCQPIQPSADHLRRVESCEEEVPEEEAAHPTCGSLSPGEEGEEEGAEQDGGLQVPREEEGRAEHRGRGARTSRCQEQELRAKLTEMETEARLLKKLMTEA